MLKIEWTGFRFKYIFILLIVLSLQGCMDKEQKMKYKIGFSQCTTADAWRKAMDEEMKREISFNPDIQLITRDAKNSSQKQIAQINELLDEGIDLLIVSPNQAKPITPIIEKIYKDGLPVIVIDRKTFSSFYTAYVGANNYEIGKIAGKYVGEMLNGAGKIIEIRGLEGSSPAIERSRGFSESLQDFPNVDIVQKVYGQWEIDTVKQIFPKVIEGIKEADLIFAHNDVMGFGAYEVCKNLGLEENFYFVGIDGLSGPNAGLQFVSDGILDATFLYPTGGKKAIDLALDILNNQPVPKENILQTTIIDQNNITVMKQQTDKIISQQKDIEKQEEMYQNQLEMYKNQKVLMYILLISFSISLIFGSYILYSLKEKQEINNVLQSKNREILQQRNQIEIIAQEAEEATQAKFKFFTNISHEFRTPLTLILASVEELQDLTKTYSKQLKKDFDLIQSNASRLLRLVNQLMDFRKIEHNKMKVLASPNNLVQFIKDIMAEFEIIASRKKIDFRLIKNVSHLEVWIDIGMFDKILFNLLSNAFKFTPEGGFINIGIESKVLENKVVLSIEDNGRGMSPNHVKHAFDRFYQGENYETFGTGLGLSLSRELIKLHHGEISVQSEKGKGSRFEITFPLGKNHFTSAELREENINKLDPAEFKYFLDSANLVSLKENASNPLQNNLSTLLIIEDNHELRELLAQKLGGFYNIEEAANGKIGLDKAFDKVPDLIICDIMLPELNGLSITEKLKNDLRTSHIPIILLTAKTSDEQQIEGIQSGADVYITKPFKFRYLFEKIKSLLKTRKQLKERFSHELPFHKLPKSENKIDKKFLNNFIVKIEENIGNPSVGVNEIAQELGLSRVQLYRKVKALLGVGVNEYIKTIRLKKAKQLIQENDMTIAEIAHKVGFSTPAYFSTAFKAMYDVSPTEYSKQH
ncbi:MAG: substrate-binding domain-containing protein [Flammeovirgaceae bacterium]|nr:substrate-binding domain-containing protein [Flammeovirgaceae bacterium]